MQIYTKELFYIAVTLKIITATEKNYRLENNKEGLTCTLYIKLVSERDFSIWEKLVQPNKKSSILWLNSTGNHFVPFQTLSFLEQWTINIVVVSKSNPYDQVWENLHRRRSSLHSAFVIVFNNFCPHYSSINVTFSHVRICYHLPLCNKTDRKLFWNAFKNFLNGKQY